MGTSILPEFRSLGKLKCNNGKNEGEAFSDTDEEDEPPSKKVNDPYLMDAEERREWRRKIREVIDRNPNVEEVDAAEKRKKMQKLLADYPLVVEEDDPNWPEDADGWGFSLGQFFDKITIKNNKKDNDDNHDSDDEIVWQDDNYIRPIKDITTLEWEEAVFKDISPLIILVHNRYKRLVFVIVYLLCLCFLHLVLLPCPHSIIVFCTSLIDWHKSFSTLYVVQFYLLS